MNVIEGRSVLEAVIARNLDANRAKIGRALSAVPQDAIVRASALRFYASADQISMGVDAAHSWRLHPNGLQQAIGIAGVPMAWTDRMTGGDAVDWQRNLFSHVMNETFEHSGARHLVRAVDGEARAVLSDKFRRLDTRPVLEAFLTVADKMGAKPYLTHACDVRSSVKVIFPKVYTINGDVVAFGAEQRGSDFGAGALQVALFLLRLGCLNGATTSKDLRMVHLGKRLDESLEYSQRTYELDTAATVSAVSDVSAKLLSEGRRESALADLQSAADKAMTSDALIARVGKSLTKEESRKVRESFEGPDVLNLPPGETVWRASNALSWLAKTSSEDRGLDLERMAGDLLQVAA